jgi:hypothetical protein
VTKRLQVLLPPSGDLQKKLSAIRGAARHDFPTADIEQMLAEIARGYENRHRE